MVSEVLVKAARQIEVLKGHYGRLAEILLECPGQYYRCVDFCWILICI